MLRLTKLPAQEGLGCSLSKAWAALCMHPSHGQALKYSSGQPCRELGCRVPSHNLQMGEKSLFFCICVVTLARKLLRLISLDLPSEVLLQSVTFSKFGKEIESALFQGGSYEFRTVIYINVRQLNLFKIYNIVAICMNVIYKI